MDRVRQSFPYEVEVTDPYWIRLADGTRIAATLWRPKTEAAVPVVVEMIPYRRRDGTVFRDLDIHPYWAGCGVACCRVDIRGTGDSDGILADEYLPREQEDAVEIIAHLAAEPWSNGNVGMTGISWGGFNALQVAARRPPALKAIITHCASDDRYADDVHYMGGALITENEMWSTFMLAKNAMAPDPQIVGGRWREMWAARLAADHSWSEHWLAHQRRDAYWKQGSISEDYAAIGCAVMAICGWEDSYSNFVPRLLANLDCPRLAILGPWTHAFPCRGDPGPRIGYLQEGLRFWQHWLAGEATGIMDEPMLRVWIGEAERPRPWYANHAGRWAAEAEWPSPRIEWRDLFLNAEGLRPAPGSGPAMSVCSPATAGTDYGRWGGYGGTSPDLAIDQRREDGQSLTFDTEPLGEDLTILGAAEVALEIVLDAPRANIAVRLCDVYPDGTSAVVTYGVLNLCHRDGHEHPSECPVGTPFKATVRLNDIGRTFPAGHRIRLAIQTQFWFVLWPQPFLVTATLASGGSALRLPVRPASPLDADVRFEPAETAPPVPSTETRPGRAEKTVTDDLGTGYRTIRLVNDGGEHSIDDRGIVTSSGGTDVFTIHPEDPLSAKLESEYFWAVRSGEADYDVHARTEFTADAEDFHLAWRLTARERGVVVHERQSTRHFPRDFT